MKVIFGEEVKSKSPLLGAMESLKKEKIELVEEKRLNNLLNMINAKMIEIEDSMIDYDFMKTEEFTRIVFDLFDKASKDYRKDKLKYYANLLINYTTLKFSKDFHKEGIIESLSKFSIDHILVLDTIYNKHIEINDEKKSDVEEQVNLCEGIMSMDIWEICINTLISYGFIHQRFWGDYIITNYGIKCIELIKNN